MTPKFSNAAVKDDAPLAEVEVFEDEEVEVSLVGDAGVAQAATFRGSSPDHSIRYGTVTIDEVVIDPRIQRPRHEPLINNIAKHFKVWALGVVVISVRETSKGKRYVLLDGQQRMAGGQLAGYTGPVQALFHYGLTFAEEAQLFRLLNTKKSVAARDMFKNLVNEGEPTALAIEAILKGVGVKVGRAGNEGFDATDMALRVAARQGGIANLQWALEVAKKSFSADLGRIYDGRVIEGLAMFKQRFSSVPTAHLVQKLGAETQDPNHLIGEAKVQARINGGRIPDGVAATLVRIYNKSKRGAGPNILPSWYEGRRRRAAKPSDKALGREPQEQEATTA